MHAEALSVSPSVHTRPLLPVHNQPALTPRGVAGVPRQSGGRPLLRGCMKVCFVDPSVMTVSEGQAR